MEHDKFCPCVRTCTNAENHRIANYGTHYGASAWCAACYLICICWEVRKARADERERCREQAWGLVGASDGTQYVAIHWNGIRWVREVAIRGEGESNG